MRIPHKVICIDLELPGYRPDRLRTESCRGRRAASLHVSVWNRFGFKSRNHTDGKSHGRDERDVG